MVDELRPFIPPPNHPRPPGFLKDEITVPPSFFDPLPDDLLDAFEGREPEPPTLVAALLELVGELREGRAQQDQATIALLEALGTLAAQRIPAPPALAGTRRGSAPDTGRQR